MSIARLTAGARVTRQAITKHLHVLAGAGLVRGARAGRDHIWQIEPSRLDEARRWLDHIEGQWDEAFSRLKASLEQETVVSRLYPLPSEERTAASSHRRA